MKCVTYAVLMALLGGSAHAEQCRQIQFRLWQNGENRFFESGEMASLEIGQDADLYIHVRSRTEGQPYSTAAVLDAPNGRALVHRSQKGNDVSKGRLTISGKARGTASVGFRLTGVKSPGRIEDVPERCRSGSVAIEVVEKPTSETFRPPPRAEADPVALCQAEIKVQLDRDLGSGEGVVLFDRGSFQGISEAFARDDPDLGDNRVGNDEVSSVRVPASCKVVLYEHQWYRGYYTILEQDVWSLEGSEVGNDAVSSVEVDCSDGEVSFRQEPDVAQLSPAERRVRGEVTYSTREDRRRNDRRRDDQLRFTYSCTVDVVSGRVSEARYRR